MLTVDYDRLDLRPGDRLLDLGCGAGRHAYEAVRRGARVIAYDLDTVEVKDTAAMLRTLTAEWNGAKVGARPGASGGGARAGAGSGSAVNGDALHLPFDDGCFDRVIAAEVLEHIPDDTAAMTELARVIRPGGSLAVTVPRFGPELVNWSLSDRYHNRPGGHVRIYPASTLARRLRAAGFEVTGRGYTHGLHSAYWWLRCAVGVDRADHPAVRAYHQVLVWDIEGRPGVSWFTRRAEAALNPMIGKSMVLYATRRENRPGTP